jgi:hypothetical protein
MNGEPAAATPTHLLMGASSPVSVWNGTLARETGFELTGIDARSVGRD